KRVDSLTKPGGCLAKSGRVARLNRFNGFPQLIDIGRHGLAAAQGDLPGDEVEGLDSIRAFVDRGDAGVAVVLSRTRFFDKAHAAMDLDAQGGNLDAD